MVELSQNPAVELFKRGGGIEPPPEIILSWPKPNYINPESHGWAGPIVLIIVIALTVVVFLARLWARQFMSKNAGLDDALIAVAMIPLIGLTIAAVLGMDIPLLNHQLLTSLQRVASMGFNGMLGIRPHGLM